MAAGRALMISIAWGESGTRCSLPAFMRPAGMVQSAFLRSISSGFAPSTSWVRVLVRIVNSSAHAAAPSCERSFAMNAPISS